MGASHPLAEAAERLPELVARARAGESVVLTEGGRPVARISPVNGAPDPTPVEIAADRKAWLDRLQRLRDSMPYQEMDSATLIRRMRDGEID